VIARESSFRFGQEMVDLDAVRRVLGAGYALSGRVDPSGTRLNVSVTLIDTRDGAVIWADRFTPGLDDLHGARHEIVDAVVGALDLQIPQAEAMAARGRPTEALDAWGAYHLGLSHLHRFNAHDNAIANSLFERATTLDPGFARAYAARSFARFQDALQWFRNDRDIVIVDVRRLAERGVELDPFDPFVNMSMGRWHWISGNPDDGIVWYDRATQLSPSHSKSHYSRGFIDAFAGRSAAARTNVDLAMGLSPLDPMIGPMLAARGLSYLVDGDDATARDWLVRAARYSSSHAGVVVGAVATSQLAGDLAQSTHWIKILREIVPDVTISMYLQSVPFADPAVRSRIRVALRAAGLPD
jgi:tetratricopeptide (TPR) repeat protein